jgi:hypothetical protein
VVKRRKLLKCEMLVTYEGRMLKEFMEYKVMIGTDYICSCKSNYHMIMATMAPDLLDWGTYRTNGCYVKYFLKF